MYPIAREERSAVPQKVDATQNERRQDENWHDLTKRRAVRDRPLGARRNVPGAAVSFERKVR